MQSLNYRLKPGLATKHTWRKKLLETRIDLLRNWNESSIGKIYPKPIKQKEVLSDSENPLTYRLSQNRDYQIIPLPSSRRQGYKSCAKQLDIPQKLHNLTFTDEKQTQNAEPLTRKRRVTEGEMAKEKTVKQISFNITKRTNLKSSSKKVNYENFIEIYNSSQPTFKPLQGPIKVLELKQVIGMGTFSQVREACNQKSRYAVKIYEKQKCFSRAKKQRIYKEIKILSGLPPHRNIISLLSAYESKTHIHLIFQLIENSQSLQSFIESRSGQLTQQQIKKIFLKVVKGVAHMHAHGISHRDLKPANIIIAHDEDNQSIVKIIDFGVAHDQPVSDLSCGTPNFLCPEQVMKKQHGTVFHADIWALGVILFYLSQKRYPFAADKQFGLYQKIQKGKYEFSTSSVPLRNLIKRMLEVDINERITIRQLVKHSWFYC